MEEGVWRQRRHARVERKDESLVEIRREQAHGIVLQPQRPARRPHLILANHAAAPERRNEIGLMGEERLTQRRKALQQAGGLPRLVVERKHQRRLPKQGAGDIQRSADHRLSDRVPRMEFGCEDVDELHVLAHPGIRGVEADVIGSLQNAGNGLGPEVPFGPADRATGDRFQPRHGGERMARMDQVVVQRLVLP